jgi:uncharacterized protein
MTPAMFSRAQGLLIRVLLRIRHIIAVAAIIGANPATLAAEAACHGRDLFPILRSKSPTNYAEIVAKTPQADKGRLFRLTSAAGSTSFLFGLLHLADPRVTEFSQPLRAALATSKHLLLESDERAGDLARAIREQPIRARAAFIAEPWRRAAALLAADDFAALEALVKKRRLNRSPTLDLSAPVLALLLNLPLCAVDTSQPPSYADARLADLARANGLPVSGMEALIEQIESLDGMTRDEEGDLLRAVIRRAEHAEDIIETEIERYQEGEIGALLAWLESPSSLFATDARIPQAFLDRLIRRRNLRLRDRALATAQRGGAFIAVGAMHLPGADGLLALFRREGFQIERIE